MKKYLTDPLILFNDLLNKIIIFSNEEIKVSSEHLFYFSYVVYLVANFFFKFTTIETVLGVNADLLANMVIYPLYILLFIKIIYYQSYSKNEVLKIISVGIIILISSYFSGVKLLVTAFIFIIAAKDIDINKVIKLTLIIQIICISIIALLAVGNIIENRTFSRKDGTIRYSLGFKHPNAFAGQILQLCICWVWIRWEKLNYKDYLFLSVLAVFIIKVCDSRTSALLILAFVGIVLMDKYFENKNIKLMKKAISIVTKLSIIICPLVSLLLGILYNSNNKFYFLIDKVISGRIKLLNDYFIKQGYSIVGQKINIISTYASKRSEYDTTALDNAYGHIAVRYGLIILIIFIIGFYLVAKKADNENNNKALICIFIYMVFGITEIYIFNLPYNVLLLLLSVAIYSYKKIDNETLRSINM